MSEPAPDLQTTVAELHATIQRQNELLEEFILTQTSFRRRIIAGLWTGLGTVLGATVMVSLLIAMLRPLVNLELVGPIVDKVLHELQTRQPLQR